MAAAAVPRIARRTGTAALGNAFSIHAGAEDGHDAAHIPAVTLLALMAGRAVASFQEFRHMSAFPTLVFKNRHSKNPSLYDSLSL